VEVAMSSADSNWKQKAKHELKEMLVLSGYLAFFFCALTTYKMFLLSQYEIDEWSYGFALLNALVITKVIMIGQYAKVGRKHEGNSVFISAIWKSFIYGLLVFAFHIVEEIIKRLIHGADVAKASRQVRIEELGANAVVVFATFIPLFIFLELRRVMGDEAFISLFFGKSKEAQERFQHNNRAFSKRVSDAL
jgi:hypothetical protein